jgi:hypothetical protein
MNGSGIINYNILKDLVTPLGISISSIAITYIVSTVSQHNRRKEELKSKRLYYIDFLVLELKKIETSLNNLLSDLDRGSAEFQLTNVTSINNAAAEIKKMIPEVIIIPEEVLREKIINFIDNVSDLALGIQALENLKGQWLNDFNGVNSSVQYELKSLKIELFKLGISINEKFKPDSLGSKKISDKQKKYLVKMVADINVRNDNAVKEWTGRFTFCKDKRLVYSTRILDVKSGLNDLSLELADTKELISKKKFLIF